MTDQQKEYGLIVYIGRFQPPHLAHVDTIKRSVEMADRVLVLCGSSNARKSPKNPFSFEQRRDMINGALKRRGLSPGSATVLPINDYLYDEATWTYQVQRLVSEHSVPGKRIAFTGYWKDDSSYYFNNFKNWEFLDSGPHEKTSVLAATNIRALLFKNMSRYIESVVDPYVYEYLTRWCESSEFEVLKEEKFLQDQQPGEKRIQTLAVVIQSGHVLLTKRGDLLSLPGHEVLLRERILDACVNSLREEVGLKVPEKVLRGSIVEKDIFDDPSRTEGDRWIAHVYAFGLSDEEKLPRVRGVHQATWIPISEAMSVPESFVDDHWHVLYHFI